MFKTFQGQPPLQHCQPCQDSYWFACNTIYWKTFGGGGGGFAGGDFQKIIHIGEYIPYMYLYIYKKNIIQIIGLPTTYEIRQFIGPTAKHVTFLESEQNKVDQIYLIKYWVRSLGPR